MLVVCGESFSYGTDLNTWPGMLAQRLQLPLRNLSIVGCSNFAICHQLQYVLDNLNPTHVIISLTAAERFEIDEDEYGKPASIKDFKTNIDEITFTSPDAKITSGNVSSQLRNTNIEMIKPYLMNSSFRLSAQNQAWAINYLTSQLKCNYLLYRNIFPRYHDNIERYIDEHYYGINNLINTGPYDYESIKVEATNHLCYKDNKRFADKVFSDLNGTQQK